MNILDLLSVDRVIVKAPLVSKKRALELSSQLLASSQTNLSQPEIFDSLLGRERLGSTGLGGGVALPHGRIAGLEKAVGAFILLAEGVDFDAIDRNPVDMIFALLVPREATEEHLQILAMLAETFRNTELRDNLRKAADVDQLLALLGNKTPQQQTVEKYLSAG